MIALQAIIALLANRIIAKTVKKDFSIYIPPFANR